MGLPDLPKVNGQSYQHATISPVILSDGGRLPLSAFKSIRYPVEAKKKPVFDAQGRRTGGFTIDKQDDGEGEIELLMDEWVAAKKYLAVAYPTSGLGEIVMDWNVRFGRTLATQVTDVLQRVMFQSDPRDSNDSQEAIYIKVAFVILGQVIDGATNKPFIIYTPPTL